ncbi:MAG: hypothetical protein JO345_08425 [Streptosporangiaceae bacterium]|nr:hypothetical protein [Streptosporangiaceae bacterium]
MSDLRVTRKTPHLDDGQPAAEPARPSPALPGHPAYSRSLTPSPACAAPAPRPARGPVIPIVAKNTEDICSKLKGPASRGILAGTKPGLSAQLRP